MNQLIDEQDRAILAERIARRCSIHVPAVGDFIRIETKKGTKYERCTHNWGKGENMQTGGMSGSYYLAENGNLSYSGGLDHGVLLSDLMPTEETKSGDIWFFHHDYRTANNGVRFMVPFRIWKIKDGADIAGISSLRCPYYLCSHKEKVGGGYHYTITIHGTSHVAFADNYGLYRWLAANSLKLSQELPEVPENSCQAIQFIGD